MNRLLGVVLCGGKSTRMGRDKALLPHSGGVTFLQHAVDRLRPITDELVIIGGDHRVDQATTIPDKLPDQGPAVGVLTAIERALQTDRNACLVTAVDLPHLTTEHLQSLLDAHQRDPQTITCAIDEQVQPLVAIYPILVHGDLVTLTQTHHRSLTRWLKSFPHQTHPLCQSALHNTNAPQDL